jgi:endonuclease/exonuclease/phosphatase family metal-dependent hydrolase
MFAIRIMTYHIHRCRGRDGNTDPQRILEVIRQGAPDLVALQDVNSGEDPQQLAFLAQRLGMKCYGGDRAGANGFLSYFPLKGVQDYVLEEDGCCIRADLDVGGKRLHVFNLRLTGFPFRRRRQIRTLLGPDLLGKASLGCPLLVIGDFAGFAWGSVDLTLLTSLQRIPHYFRSATYPAVLPLFSRDRGYMGKGLRVEQAVVQRRAPAREASSHLPVIYTVRFTDPRQYLRVDKLKNHRIETAPG